MKPYTLAELDEPPGRYEADDTVTLTVEEYHRLLATARASSGRPTEDTDIEALEMAEHEAQAQRIIGRGLCGTARYCRAPKGHEGAHDSGRAPTLVTAPDRTREERCPARYRDRNHCTSFLGHAGLHTHGGITWADRTREELPTRAQQILDAMPPFYAYGDNEAACWMADRIKELVELARQGVEANEPWDGTDEQAYQILEATAKDDIEHPTSKPWPAGLCVWVAQLHIAIEGVGRLGDFIRRHRASSGRPTGPADEDYNVPEAKDLLALFRLAAMDGYNKKPVSTVDEWVEECKKRMLLLYFAGRRQGVEANEDAARLCGKCGCDLDGPSIVGSCDHVYEPNGLRFHDVATGRDMLLVCETGHDLNGWLCFRHPDGQWVTQRKATADDLDRLSSTLGFRVEKRAARVPETQEGK